jgi:hypothetical protein
MDDKSAYGRWDIRGNYNYNGYFNTLLSFAHTYPLSEVFCKQHSDLLPFYHMLRIKSLFLTFTDVSSTSCLLIGTTDGSSVF